MLHHLCNICLQDARFYRLAEQQVCGRHTHKKQEVENNNKRKWRVLRLKLHFFRFAAGTPVTFAAVTIIPSAVAIVVCKIISVHVKFYVQIEGLDRVEVDTLSLVINRLFIKL